MTESSVVLRLAGPMQSWGSASEYNRRETDLEPTKSGVLGLLAAALGRRRSEPIEDLLGLMLAVRVDQPGSLLRDYHTVSDLHQRPLLSAVTQASGRQKPTSPKKYTHVTRRFYLQDAVFVAAISSPGPLVADVARAVRHPVFPLALGRRACVPTQPVLIPSVDGDLWPGSAVQVIREVPWQAGRSGRNRPGLGASVPLPVTYDDPAGIHARSDLPVSFVPERRGMRSRTVSQTWVSLPTGRDPDPELGGAHDPFLLLGW